MPLRDTLNRLREQHREGRAAVDRQMLLTEWKGAVDALLTEIHNYLAEYVEDGSLSINPRRIRLTEDSLGTYEIGALDIEAGPALILVRPVGLGVIGAEGRVDMHRMGRPAEQHRIMLLRMRSPSPTSQPAWFIHFPPETTRQMVFRYQFPSATREITPLTKETLEEAVEFLLQ